jgi:hypothetical protein
VPGDPRPRAYYVWAAAAVVGGLAIAAFLFGTWVEMETARGVLQPATRGRFVFIAWGFVLGITSLVIPALFRRSTMTRSESILARARREHYGEPRIPRLVFAVTLVAVLIGDAALAVALFV